MVLSPSKLVTGWHQVGIKGDRASTLLFSYVDRFLQANPKKMREPTSGLEPLTCSLRVIHHVLQGLAWGCKSRIFRALCLPCLAAWCTVLRSRWYQSGIKRGTAASRSCSRVAHTRRTSNASQGTPAYNLPRTATLTRRRPWAVSLLSTLGGAMASSVALHSNNTPSSRYPCSVRHPSCYRRCRVARCGHNRRIV